MAGKELNLKRAPSVKFRLLTQTRNQMLSLAMLKVILRKKKRNNSGSSCKPQQS